MNYARFDTNNSLNIRYIQVKIAIASGKGGTGKTTVAVNLYYFLSHQLKNKVQLIDCDVEEPNVVLFFPNAQKIETKKINSLVPEIDTEKCTFCKKCSEWCEFNAITLVKNIHFAEINTDLCHSCGACTHACNFNAITEHPLPLGTISHYSTAFGNGISEGRLVIGSAMQTAMIKAVKKEADKPGNILLFDSPPGTSCPVVETIANVDYVILVTEPTPFGLYDLQLTVNLLKELKIPFGVIVNKSGLGNENVYQYLEDNNIELLGQIPFSKAYASVYSQGRLVDAISGENAAHYQNIVKKIIAKQ